MNHSNLSLFTLGGILLAATICVTGCETTSTGGSAAEPAQAAVVGDAGVVLHKDKDIQGVWLAPGFNFTGYDALYVEPTQYAAEVRDNEARERETAIRDIQFAITATAQASGVFPSVTAGSPTGAGKALRLANTIIKFEKGGGAARYFAGIYGAGQPHIRVRGQVFADDKLVCVYEVERSGEGAGARLNGAWKSDESILSNDIADLANDLADFFKRTAGR